MRQHARKPLVTAQELAQILNVSRSTIYRHKDQLGYYRIGARMLRFDVDWALENWPKAEQAEVDHGRRLRAPYRPYARRRR